MKKFTLVAVIVASMVLGALIVGVVRPATAASRDPQLAQIVDQLKTLNARIGTPAPGFRTMNYELPKIEHYLEQICLNVRQTGGPFC